MYIYHLIFIIHAIVPGIILLNTGATNVSGFTALPGGLFEVVAGNKFWGMLYNDHLMVSSNEGRVENTGLSIRLIKD